MPVAEEVAAAAAVVAVVVVLAASAAVARALGMAVVVVAVAHMPAGSKVVAHDRCAVEEAVEGRIRPNTSDAEEDTPVGVARAVEEGSRHQMMWGVGACPREAVVVK